MKRLAHLSGRARWAVPVGAAAVVGGVLAGSMVSVAQAAPALPARSPAQLLAAVAEHTSPQPLTGTVLETASLGLPQLPGTNDPTSPTSLLTGSHRIEVWYAGPAHYRVALPGSMNETDVYRSGDTAWLWQSATNTATLATLPAHTGRAAAPAAPRQLPLTPQQAANQALAAVGPTTDVSVDRNVTVANRPSYQLVLAPKSHESLVGQIRIALDARHDVPLQVQVFTRNATKPAFQVGFTSVSFGPPPARDLAFSAPAGAKVRHANLAAGTAGTGAGLPHGVALFGTGWLTVADLPGSAFATASGASAPAAGSPSGSTFGVDSGAVLRDLLRAATPVHGAWGRGRLLRTSLLSVLVTDNGRVLLGAVEPTVLYEAATQAARTPLTGNAPLTGKSHPAQGR